MEEREQISWAIWNSGSVQWKRGSRFPGLSGTVGACSGREGADFLGYLEQWERAVEEREGFTVGEKKTMLLSAETAVGLKLTGM